MTHYETIDQAIKPMRMSLSLPSSVVVNSAMIVMCHGAALDAFSEDAYDQFTKSEFMVAAPDIFHHGVDFYGGNFMVSRGGDNSAAFERIGDIPYSVLKLSRNEDENPSPDDAERIATQKTRCNAKHNFHRYDLPTTLFRVSWAMNDPSPNLAPMPGTIPWRPQATDLANSPLHHGHYVA
jgi:hypothetical protein